MKNATNPGSRQRSSFNLLPGPSRHRGSLPGAGSILVYCSICVLFALPALLGSCQREPVPETPEEDPEPPVVVIDSVLTHVVLRADGRTVHTLDLFVYGADGLRSLERHLELKELPEALDVRTPPGEKLLVGIANSPRRFNQKALERYEAMEQLCFDFADDDPACPILGGCASTKDLSGEIELKPLLCSVTLAKISNTMDNYELLEEPRIRLRDLPNAAEILREQEFRPTELIDAGPWSKLPYDVGFFSQEPGITLWCYPNDTPEDVLGVPRPSLEFECKIRGETCSFNIPLPPLPRGSSREVELTVDGPGSFHYKFR